MGRKKATNAEAKRAYSSHKYIQRKKKSKKDLIYRKDMTPKERADATERSRQKSMHDKTEVRAKYKKMMALNPLKWPSFALASHGLLKPFNRYLLNKKRGDAVIRVRGKRNKPLSFYGWLKREGLM